MRATSFIPLIPLGILAVWMGLFYSGALSSIWVTSSTYIIAALIITTTAMVISRPDDTPWYDWFTRTSWLLCAAISVICGLKFWSYFVQQGIYNTDIITAIPKAWYIASRLNEEGKLLFFTMLAGIAIPVLVTFTDLTTPSQHKHLSGKRKRADSDLYGDSDFMPEKSLLEMSKEHGIILGQLKPVNFVEEKKRKINPNKNPVISYPLESNIFTIAPPRVNKTSLICTNLLYGRIRKPKGSRVIIDPRGETFLVCANVLEHIGRDVILLDPFGVVKKYKPELAAFCKTYNPLDFIRKGDDLKGDIDMLLDAIISPPVSKIDNTAEHFHDAVTTIVGGFIAWVVSKYPKSEQTLQTVYELISQQDEDLEELFKEMLQDQRFACGMPYKAAIRSAKISKREGGAGFSSFQRAMKVMEYQQIIRQTGSSGFDPHDLSKGNMDIFVVVPRTYLKPVASWIKIWVTIPINTAYRQIPKHNTLIIIDEMPTLGPIDAVIDSYLMSSGDGISIWGFSQSIPDLERTYGKEATQTIVQQAEVFQLLEMSRSDEENADKLSRIIGHVTYESRTTSMSGSTRNDSHISEQQQRQQGTGLVRERLVTADQILKMDASEQYILVSSKIYGKSPIKIGKLRYWNRKELYKLASSNPYQTRKGN